MNPPEGKVNLMTKRKQTLVLDFDGVLHSYSSGWKGPRNIPDPPNDGALAFLDEALRHFDVAVLSSRSHYLGGRRAMKRWLNSHISAVGAERLPFDHWLLRRICDNHTMEPWEHEVERAATAMVGAIAWPLHKPPAHVSLDDRGWRFDGAWPTMQEIKDFRPWHKR